VIEAPPAPPRRQRLLEVALVFGRLGATSFGGPAAHVALMEDELVHRRGWVTRERFLDLLGAANLIPGPNSTELAIHLGYVRAGFPGLLAAGAAFILPAALATAALAWAYVRYGALPDAPLVLAGVKPVVLVVVLEALWRFARSLLRTRRAAILAALATAAAALGVNELALLLAAGIAAVALGGRGGGARGGAAPLLLPLALGGAAAAAPASAGGLFLVFLKIGSVLYGSGYVLLAFLRADLVLRLGWLTDAQLLDAVAMGQVTPGPVFSTATFVGYVAGGGWGAAAATLGIFLPAFVLVAASGPLVPRLRASARAGAFLDGVNAASLALMAVVTVRLGADALGSPASFVLAAAALVLLRLRVSSAWLVLGGAAAGGLLAALR
jgi:chromate transporter